MNRVSSPTSTSRPATGTQADFFQVRDHHAANNGVDGANRKRPRLRNGLKAPSPVGKNFILDTNVLIHDPGCIDTFAENHVCIPFEVLCELDRFKNEQSERGANARQVHRDLAERFSSHPEAAVRGIPTPGGGTVRLVICRAEDRRIKSAVESLSHVLPDLEAVDHRILLCARVVGAVNSAPAVLVTKDLNLQLKAYTLGLPCDDYLNDKVGSAEAAMHSTARLEVEANELQRFASSGSLELDGAVATKLSMNDYVLLAAGDKRTMPARFVGGGKFERLRLPDSIRIQKGTPIRPLNLGQQCFMDALLNPKLSLVTCYGQAGTGKTLLAVACALNETLARNYSGVTVSRPVIPLGDTLGFLPGSLDEKLNPWLKPVFDALEFVLAPSEPNERQKKPRRQPNNSTNFPAGAAPKIYQPFLDSGMIEIEALCYIRGRSIPKRFFILDEAQQLTPLEAKTIVTRMAKGSKLILVGDPEQIDNPYVDSRSNGLVYTRDRLKNERCSAHVTLERGERSALAEAGARLM